MFKRINNQKEKLLRRKYLMSQLFCDMLPALRWVYKEYEDLSPIEAWSEALNECKELNNYPRQDLVIDDIAIELEKRYKVFIDEDGTQTHRNSDDAKRSAFIVLSVMLYQLACVSLQKENHPRKVLCKALARVTFLHPLREKFCSLIRQSEDKEEQAGRRIEAFDIMMELLLSDEDEKEKSNQEKVEGIDKLVNEAMAMDTKTMEELERMLSRMNDRDGHLYDKQLNKLRAAIDTKTLASYIPKNVSNLILEQNVQNQVGNVETGANGFTINQLRKQ